MKYILLSIFTIGILTSCDPKSNYIDTGISNGLQRLITDRLSEEEAALLDRLLDKCVNG